VNGQPVKSNSELRNSIGLLRVGDKVDIGLVRDGKPIKVTAVIADATVELTGGPQSIHKSFDGATLTDAPDAGGALVKSVEPGSAAAEAGLRADDVIVGANRGRVSSLRDLHERARGSAVLVLEVRRSNTVILIPLK
jgi:S1-C subfamily serine protease